MRLHPSELSRLAGASHRSRETAEPLVAPGSMEEQLALENIDIARYLFSRSIGEDYAARRKRFARALHRDGLKSDETGRG